MLPRTHHPCRAVIRALGCSLPHRPGRGGPLLWGEGHWGGCRGRMEKVQADQVVSEGDRGRSLLGSPPLSFSASDTDAGRHPRPSLSRRAVVPTRNSCPQGRTPRKMRRWPLPTGRPRACKMRWEERGAHGRAASRDGATKGQLETWHRWGEGVRWAQLGPWAEDRREDLTRVGRRQGPCGHHGQREAAGLPEWGAAQTAAPGRGLCPPPSKWPRKEASVHTLVTQSCYWCVSKKR